MNNDIKSQGQRLKEIRQDLNLTQNEIADKMGISQVMWCRYESGAAPVSRRTLMFLERDFNINPKYICGQSEDMYIVQEEEDNKTDVMLDMIVLYQQLTPAKKKAIDKLLKAIMELLAETTS